MKPIMDLSCNQNRSSGLLRHAAKLRFAVLAGSLLVVKSAWSQNAAMRKAVDAVARPLMRKYGIPGLAIGVISEGRRMTFDYGVASRATGRPVSNRTLFEIGSVSKTFTVTMAARQVAGHRLAWSDPVSRHLPSLRGSAFDRITLLNLATHTSGGLPLQVPDSIRNIGALMSWLREWKAAYPPGSRRVYSNVSIGLLGLIAARSMRVPFETAMEQQMLPALGLADTFITVPPSRIERYAQGYTKDDASVRVNPGVLASEAYGLKSCTTDLLRFVEANLDSGPTAWDGAIASTHVGYFSCGQMTQDLIWEQYPYPAVVAGGDSSSLFSEADVSARPLSPQLPPPSNVLVGKTGSTSGFGAFVGFNPKRCIGVVILANKNYPTSARVAAALQVLAATGSSRAIGGTRPSSTRNKRRTAG